MIPFFVADGGHARGIVPAINRLAETLRELGGTVTWVVPAAVEPAVLDMEFYGPDVAATYGLSGGDGPVRDRLWGELAVVDGDLFPEKRSPSALFPGHTDLHDQLTARGIDTVLIAGTVANVCCESTARDAKTLGYRVVMAADANAAATDDMLNATLRTVYRSFGDVRPVDEVCGLLASFSRSGRRRS